MSSNTQVAQKATEENSPMLAIKSMLLSKSAKKRFSAVLPNEKELQEYLSHTVVYISHVPELWNCSHDSIMQAAIDGANFGLVPNKLLGHADIIARRNKKKGCMEATYQIGYKGYIQKFFEAGWTVDVGLVTVNEMNDPNHWVEQRGTKVIIQHFPKYDERPTKENIALAYATARKPGFEPIAVVMRREEIEQIENAIQGGSVWKSKIRDTDYGEQCKKTAVRRLSKVTPVKAVNMMNAWEGEREGQIIKDITPVSVGEMGGKLAIMADKGGNADSLHGGADTPEPSPPAADTPPAEEGKEPSAPPAEEAAPIEEPPSSLFTTAPDGTIQLYIDGKAAKKTFEAPGDAGAYLFGVMKKRTQRSSRENLFDENIGLIALLEEAEELDLIDKLKNLIEEGE